MKYKKNESGRSMVEMLGVLAIIGVLSVGGIAGYSLSMRRHRANGVVDVMAKYALVLYGTCQQKISNNETGAHSVFCSGNKPNFADTDVGSIPAGVKYIQDYHYIAPSSHKEGSDVVQVSALFDDDKLCKAVASIIGGKCDSNGEGDFVTFNFFYN